MNRSARRSATRTFVATLGATLERVPEDELEDARARTDADCTQHGKRVGPHPTEAWRSRTMTVQIYPVPLGTSAIERISIRKNDQSDMLGWDQIQAIKTAIGRGDKNAVEVYPDDHNVINVANMRHLWILPGLPDFAWGKP